MVTILTILLMLIVGYVYFREGVFTAFTMCVNVFLAGLIAFNFFEPLANVIEPALPAYNPTAVPSEDVKKGESTPPPTPPFFWGYEDALSLLLIFSLTLGILRWITNSLASFQMEFSPLILQGGGVLFGLLTGYLLSGFLICLYQTLPWHKNFLDFESVGQTDSTFRDLFPPDRVWLAMMRHAGAFPLANREDKEAQREGHKYFNPNPDPYDRYLTFDKYGTFELRYLRYRRYDDKSEPRPYLGELDTEIHRQK
jgi:hypothetical protein